MTGAAALEKIPELSAGAAEVVPDGGLAEKLDLGRPLRVKLGLDPTAENVTLGWAVVLRKLRQFQDLGHVAVLIVGDFTARVGDPSGRSETRPRLAKDVVREYADRLLEQFWLVLDRDRTEVRHNSEWLESLDMEGVLRLTASYTVARMLERDDFATRYADARPISIMEFLYPLLQGYDSVAVEADVELGGNDQLFNLLVGREIQREFGQLPQVALTMPLLVGTDGVHKMSQSLGNYVAVTDPPEDMFGKLARVPDGLIAEYRMLTLDFFRDPGEPERVRRGLAEGNLDPWQEKRRLAREVVNLYHGPGAGAAAEARFDEVHRDRRVPDDVPEMELRPDWALEGSGRYGGPTLLWKTGLASSKSEARRLIAQGGARLDGVPLTDAEAEFGAEELVGKVLSVSRRRFVRLR